MTGAVAVALAVEVASAEVETRVLPLDTEDEDVGIELAVEASSARFSNCPGCHITGAQSFDARAVVIRHEAMMQRTMCRDQDVLWGDFMAFGRSIVRG